MSLMLQVCPFALLTWYACGRHSQVCQQKWWLQTIWLRAYIKHYPQSSISQHGCQGCELNPSVCFKKEGWWKSSHWDNSAGTHKYFYLAQVSKTSDTYLLCAGFSGRFYVRIRVREGWRERIEEKWYYGEGFLLLSFFSLPAVLEA